LIGFGGLLAAASCSGAVFLKFSGLRLAFPGRELAVDIAVELIVALTAAEISIFLNLLFPKLAEMRAAMSASASQVLATLPALSLLAIPMVRPDLPPAQVGMIALCTSVAAFGLGLFLLDHWFRPDFLLQA
jgi:hypothetical protein